jgi:hypothetical protein
MKEKLRMQFLAGLITESKYKQLLEYSKSQREFILSKLNSSKSLETDALFNSLNQQEITYQDIKKQIENKTIKNFEDLKKLKTITKSDVKKQSKSGVEKLLDNEDFLIVEPKTYKSNCYYGAGTKWCTTSKGEEGRYKFKNHSYYKLIFIIDKSKQVSDPLHKVAFTIDSFLSPELKRVFSYTFFDSEDEYIKDKNGYLTYLKNKGVNINDIFLKHVP